MKACDISRDNLKNSFLKNYFKSTEFKVYPLPADASFRTYDRVNYQGKNFILMNSPPDHYNLAPFIKIAILLKDNKLLSPAIFQADEENGFLLLEDFGSISINQHLLDTPTTEKTKQIYSLIIELLVEVQKIECKPQDNLISYDLEILLKELELYTQWYIPYAQGAPLNDTRKYEFINIWEDVLNKLPKHKPCLILRDFHVENMMLLNNDGMSSIGLLDFQDAVIGNPLYDLVSVLEDARIEVLSEVRDKFLDYYLSLRHDISVHDGYLSYHILAAQRNLRILGVFARKAVRDGQENYLKYIPRLLNYLEHDLSHEALSPVRNWIEKNL